MKERTRTLLAIVLIVLFGALSLYGLLFTGEGQIVFLKASNICLECIGIG